MRNDLYTIDGVIYSAGRLLIPRLMISSLLEDLHIGHQGVNAMKANARQRFFWPRMNKQIQQVRDNCRRCNEIAPSQRKENTNKNCWYCVNKKYFIKDENSGMFIGEKMPIWRIM